VLLEAAERRGTRFLPVIVSPCLYTSSPLCRFQAVNAPERPLAKLTKAGRDQVFSELARAIAAELPGEGAASGPTTTSSVLRAVPQATDQTTGPDDSEAQSRRGSPAEGQLARHSLGTLIFGGLLLAFLFVVFAFAPPVLPDYKHRILALCAALLAGLFGWFLTGEIGLRIDALQSLFGDLKIRASGGLALFVLVLGWWLSPLAPVAGDGTDNSGEADQPTVRLQTLAGNLRDAKTGEPVSDVQVSLPKYGKAVRSNRLGRFTMQVEGPHQASVELMAHKSGYRTHEQYATLGNTSLDIDLQEDEP
jgi:hypothetical protein